MEEKKLSMGLIIILVVISLGLGLALGYILTVAQENDKELISLGEENTPKVDGSKEITVDGKEYTVSYVNKYLNDNTYNVTIYLNGKEIKTFKEVYNLNEVWKENEELELHKIIGSDNNEFILIVLNSNHPGANNVKDFCIVETDGNILGIFNWSSASGIVEKDGKEHTSERTYLTYEINKDNIVLYEAIYKQSFNYVALKYKITVNMLGANMSVEKGYTSDEIEIEGK